jgi:hypothetical protein
MFGIWAKIKNGFNWIKDHIVKPVVQTAGKVINNPFFNSLVKVAAPVLNSVMPGLGMRIQTGIGVAQRVIPVADQLLSDLDKGGAHQVFQNATQGNYNKALPQSVQRLIQSGVGLARRPNQLHNRLQLRALPGPQKEMTIATNQATSGAPQSLRNPRVEELD